MGNIIFLPAWATYTVAVLIILAIIAAVFQKEMEMPSNTDEDICQKSKEQMAKLINMSKGLPLATLIIVMIMIAVYAFWRYDYIFTPAKITFSTILVFFVIGMTFIALSESKKLTTKSGFMAVSIWIALYIAILLLIIKLVVGLIFLLLLLACFGYYAWFINK